MSLSQVKYRRQYNTMNSYTNTFNDGIYNLLISINFR